VLYTRLPGRKDKEYDLTFEDGMGTYALSFRPKSSLPWTGIHSRHDNYSKEESRDVVLFQVDEIEYDGRTVLHMLEFASQTENLGLERLENHLLVLTLLIDQPETFRRVFSEEHLEEIIRPFCDPDANGRTQNWSERLRRACPLMDDGHLIKLSSTLLQALESAIESDVIENYYHNHQSDFEQIEVLTWSSTESESLTLLSKLLDREPLPIATLTWFLQSPATRKAETQIISKAEFSTLVELSLQSPNGEGRIGPHKINQVYQLVQVIRFHPPQLGNQTRQLIQNLLMKQKIATLKAGIPIHWFLDRGALISTLNESQTSTAEFVK
jgi:hypothetical protein